MRLILDSVQVVLKKGKKVNEQRSLFTPTPMAYRCRGEGDHLASSFHKSYLLANFFIFRFLVGSEEDWSRMASV